MWILPILIVGVAVLLSIPVGRYMAKVMDSSFKPPGVLRWIRGSGRYRPAGLEAVFDRNADVQHGRFCGRLCDSGPSALAAVESRQQGNAFAIDDLPHDFVVPGEHAVAALFGRSPSVVLQPALFHRLDGLYRSDFRTFGLRGRYPGVTRRTEARQFLHRHVAGLVLCRDADQFDRGRHLHGRRHADDAERQRLGHDR